MTAALPFPNALHDRQLAVVDVEGNGQNPPEIIEIAVLPVDGPTTPIALRSWLIKPKQPVTSLVTRKVHGIKNADLAHCPSWHEVADDIEKELSGRVLVAHNATVERRVLAAHLPDWNPPLILDTLRLAKSVWRGLDSYALDKLIERGQLDTDAVAGQGYHRAGYDTWAAWQLLCALITDGDLDWPGVVEAAGLSEFLSTPEPEGGLW
ncbi:3'-5' exonuclease [Nocardia terpenica]|uniref:3'-5' exonuclease n=1 Tax=Nocardia terpenica TaxID=455432 RepID=UPI00189585AA|nr:3'-5' exonuclease [Nocardia terpenica]MBF6066188.1 3'-5' exonuclease [Nocardia terpenica]MBF6109288.1 3'-5' exonuclease [Nocardia terpenica]MBF6116406.1 3'-5' exonuclease [Nocardia terpenica]MBF6123589.1 3'-5' exonuclease [Nocardia terpenica]MBF6156839.1 3'-5' exonuclease [Nocardia terpenica]